MYLYFNEQGVLTTQIPHGEIVRQSGTFTMSFAFEKDYDFVNRYGLTITFKRPGEKGFGNTYFIPTNKPRTEIFKKVKPSEMTYSFIEGQTYTFYDFTCDSVIAASERAGEVQAVVRILDKKTLDHENQKTENVIAQGLIQFYVERTYGAPYSNTISPTQYDYLLAYIDKNISDIKSAYIKSVDFEEGTYRLTFVKQDNSQLVVDLPIETMKTDIENLKANLGIEVNKLQAQIDGLIAQVDGKQETLISGQNIRELISSDGTSISLLPKGEYDKQLHITRDIVEPYNMIEGFNTEDETLDVLIKIDDADLLSMCLNPNIKNNLVLKDKLGKPNGVATLNQEGKVPTEQLPSYVDDVIEYENKTQFPQPGEGGKIYVDKFDNKTYRWSGTAYIEISASLTLGETASTAYPGDKGAQNAKDIANLKSNKQDKLTEKQINDINDIPNKLNKVSGAGRVYTTDGMVGYTVGATNDTIVKRTNEGRIKSRAPIEDDDVVTKSYLVGSEGIKTANDLLVLLETDNTGRMIVDLNEIGNKVEVHLDNTFVETLLTTSKLGQANGVASLDSNGMVPSTQLPSYVDDILEFATKTAFPTIGETGKIYVARDTNLVYRWSGSDYVEISKSLAIGDTTGTAYDGGKGSQNAKDISTLRTDKQDKLIAGANIEIQGTTISSKLTPATANVIGGIKVGDGLKVDSTGLLSVNFATTEEVQAMFAPKARGVRK